MRLASTNVEVRVGDALFTDSINCDDKGNFVTDVTVREQNEERSPFTKVREYAFPKSSPIRSKSNRKCKV